MGCTYLIPKDFSVSQTYLDLPHQSYNTNLSKLTDMSNGRHLLDLPNDTDQPGLLFQPGPSSRSSVADGISAESELIANLTSGRLLNTIIP
jgi:hypothetical protein